MHATDSLVSAGRGIAVSRIRELANQAMDIEGLIPLWFGESDQPTPRFIIDAGKASISEGHTFYTEGLGKPWLREELAAYMTRLYETPIAKDRIAVTVSGTNAINLAFQMIAQAGDRMVTTLPAFPTLMTVPALQHVEIDTVAIKPASNGWKVDLDHLLEKAKHAKILLLNSPNNPTGWVLERDEIKAILKACRENGTWIISDEVYARITYDGKPAPSFAEFAEPEDRVLVVNSFSKSWAMTGWRIGWLTLPVSLLAECEKLMEFSMSCAPEFVQAGALAALRDGEDFLRAQMVRFREGRDLSIQRLKQMPGVSVVPPAAAFYAFFRIDGVTDDVSLAKAMAREAGVGIAPGSAFDPSKTNWFRVCFAKEPKLLEEAFDRMGRFLETR